MLKAVRHSMLRWRDFRGRTTRRDFWLFFAFLFLISAAADIVQAIQNSGENGGRFTVGINLTVGPAESWWDNIFGAVFIIPLIAAITRRCHDAGYRASTFLVVFFGLYCLNVFVGKAFGHIELPVGVFIVSAILIVGWIIFVLTRPSTTPSIPNEVPQ